MIKLKKKSVTVFKGLGFVWFLMGFFLLLFLIFFFDEQTHF